MVDEDENVFIVVMGGQSSKVVKIDPEGKDSLFAQVGNSLYLAIDKENNLYSPAASDRSWLHPSKISQLCPGVCDSDRFPEN
ncbi:MAG: hypothetical protein JRJ87_19750 [Deltaproteobacteria bacterium]|nr:hypothetical protein [Deltaproteobacteria bacterium]